MKEEGKQKKITRRQALKIAGAAEAGMKEEGKQKKNHQASGVENRRGRGGRFGGEQCGRAFFETLRGFCGKKGKAPEIHIQSCGGH